MLAIFGPLGVPELIIIGIVAVVTLGIMAAAGFVLWKAFGKKK